MTKVYGEDYGEKLTSDDIATTAEATFIGQDNKEHNVNEAKYKAAFTEGAVSDYYTGKGTFTSAGWAKTATRTGGNKAAADNNNAIYNIKAASNNYELTAKGTASGYAGATTKDGGTVEILRRQINVNGSGSQTYGNATINDWKLTASLTGKQEGATGEALVKENNDTLDNRTDILSIKSGSSYAENQNGRTTANASPDSYEDAVNMVNVGFENGAGVNYEIVDTQGDLKVNKANLTITTNGFEKVYGDVEGVQNALKNAVTVTGLTNGDNNGESTITVDGTSEALIDVDGEIRTNNVKNGGYDIDAVLAPDLQNTINTNYNVTPSTGKAVLTKKGLTLITDDINTTYGDGNTIRDKVNNDLLHLEGLVPWDKESDVFAEITPGVSVDTTNKSQSPYKIVDGKPATDEKGNLYTNDVKDDKGYSITTNYHNVANNYDVTSTEGHVKVTKAKLQVKVGDVSTTYGTAFDTSKYTYSYADGIVNGDTAESLNASLSSKLGLLPRQYVNTAARDGKDDIWTADAGNGYTISLKSTNGRNFFDYYLKNYDTEVLAGNATVDKANLVVNVGNAETVYGTPFDEKRYGYAYSTETGKNLVNGDTKDSLATGLGTIKYYNDAALNGTTTGRWTKDVGNNYLLTFTDGTKGAFNALNNYNVSFVDGKASVTPAPLKVNRKGYTTEYGTVLLEDAAHRFTTWGTLVNGDVDDIKVDNKNYGGAYLDGNTRTNDASDTPYTFKEALTSESNVLRNYTLDDTGMNSVTITPYTITSKDIVNGNPEFSTVYGDTTTPVEVTIKGVNGDVTVGNTATTSAYEYGTDGTPVKTKDVGDKIYDITSVLTNKNYRFEDGSDTKLFANTASVTPAPLKVNRKGYTTEYGTVLLEDAAHRFTTWGTLVNGDVDDIKVDNKNYGGAYLDGNTRTNDASDTPYTFKEALTSESNVLRNYTLDDTGMNSVTITPYTITSKDIVNGNPEFSTVYGDTTTPVEVTIKGVNGDVTVGNTATTSAYEYGTDGTPVKTKDVGDKIYDITSVLTNKNYRFEDGSDTKLFANTASVTPAPLKVNRKGYTTEYGTVLLEDAAHRFTTWGTLVNGDVDDIKVDNKNYGGAYLDGNTRTNDASDTPYTFKEALTSESNVLRNYTLDDTGMNSVTITPYTITSKDIVNGNPEFSTVYGDTTTPVEVAIKGVNGDVTVANTATTSAYEYGTDGTPVKTKDAGDKIYDITSVLTNKNYQFENGESSKTFEKTASVTPATLKVNRKGYTTEYGTVLLEDAAHRFTTWGTLVNGDVDDIKVDNKDYGGAYLDGNTRTNDASDTPYTFKEALTSESNVLRNYTLDDTGMNSVTITPYTITSKDIVNGNPEFSTVYGDTTTPVEVAIKGVNGDVTVANTATTSAYEYGTDGTPVKTKDAGDKIYDITSVLTNKNYQFENGESSKTFEKTASVTPATLKVNRKGYTTEYGTVLLEDAAHRFTTWGTLVNGDVDDIKVDNKDYGGAYLDGNTRTNDASDTPYTFKEALTSESNVLRNYTLDDTGMNSVTITPYTITSKDIVNGNPEFSTVYGDTTTPVEVAIKGVNGDVTVDNKATTSAYIYDDATGEVVKTKDVGTKTYDITSVLMNKNYQFENGESSKTFEKTASVTPAELTIKTKDVETEYGTVKTTTSEVDGLRNGDLPTGFIYDYGNYGGAYLDGNTKTNDVNTYHFGTTLSGAEFLKNYTITGGEADVKIDPKDVTFFVSGTGNTLDDITYTVDPDIDAQLAYGEHVDADYTPGNTVGDNQYGVVANINGTPIITGNVAGNYRYNYGGLITITPAEPTNPTVVPTKPDIDPHNPSNLDGSGSWTSNMGNHGVPGVERVAGLASAELPFFKVEAGQVSHYGTYDVAADPDKVRLEPTGKRLPEPNQPKTQYREYTKALTTTDGTGMFRMVYDGSTFNITPVDDGALALMRMGDVKNNVELSAEALHAGFSEMGILLEDLDGVYVHFDTMA